MKKKGAVRAFWLRGRGLTRVLGSLEAEVMEEIWQRGESSIREIWEALSRRRRLAFNTVMTVMNRLVEKGMLVRRGAPGSYRFAARESREAFMARISRAIAEGLIRDFGDLAVSQFVAALQDVDPEKLKVLERAISEGRVGRRRLPAR